MTQPGDGNDGTATDTRPATPAHPAGSARPAPLLDDLRIRPYGVNDADALRRMSPALSRQSLYQRFSSGTPTIPELYVRHLQRMDHWDHDALVALHRDEIVGIAEYVRERAEPRHADLAVLIADPWQRHGLGRLLVALLVPMATRRGITGFGVDVMPDNAGAHSAVRSGWPGVQPYRTDGFAHYDLPLRPPPRPAASPAAVFASAPAAVPAVPAVPAMAPAGLLRRPPAASGDGHPRVPATLR